MTEYYTKGLVLERSPRGEFDESIILYTKDLGKISASAKSIRKIGSKLSGHLQVGSLVKVRIVKSSGYRVVDAISEVSDVNREIIRFMDFINKMTPYESIDLHLWHGVEYIIIKSILGEDSKILSQKVYQRFLEIFGFGSKFATCNNCDSKEVSHFHPLMLIFLCSNSLKKLSINEEETIQI